jgi:hypothetical protein
MILFNFIKNISIMKQISLFVLLLFTGRMGFTQLNETDRIRETINLFFEGLNGKDTVKLQSTVSDAMVLQTIVNKNGKVEIRTETFSGFKHSIAAIPAETSIEEKITFGNLLTDSVLSSVWMPYRFFVNGKISHCGTNSFQLAKINGDWKITYIIDTRRKDCEIK